MRYNEEENRLLITCRELVMTARRGISTTLPCDSDEPEFITAKARLPRELICEGDERILSLDFESGEYNFSLTASADKIEECKLWFTTLVDCNPKRPKKEQIAEIRGEAFVTAYIYARGAALTRVELSFIYFNPETTEYNVVSEEVEFNKLERFFKKCVGALSVYAMPEIDRVKNRLPSMKNIKFPYRFVREGQSEFVRRAYKIIVRGGVLYGSAPTGTGKTVSALFPAIRAMGEGKGQKTFYLTPKETTANAAIDCINLLCEGGAIIRAVKLTAKEKACSNGVRCRENRDSCQNAKCNKLSEAALALYGLALPVITAKEIDAVAREYTVCPYELSLTYSELCDVVICDFNYLFDPQVYIRRFFTLGGDYIFLIDEAHNLPDRAREMYSASLTEAEISEPSESELLGPFSATKENSRNAAIAFREILYKYIKEEIRRDEEEGEIGATHLKDVPFELYDIFDKLLMIVEDEIFDTFSAKDDEKAARLNLLRGYYYKIKKFRTVMQRFNSSFETFIFLKDGIISAKLYCIDTGKEISERLDKGRAAVFFSATLKPLYYYKSLLGGDGTTDSLDVDSPFEREQLSVSIMDKISTRYREREDTLLSVCRAIAATVSAKRGNYMIFSPSFAYSEALAKAFAAKYPKIKILSQKKNATRAEKAEFLAEFSKESDSYLIGFCVMGGIYAEGIDLVGDSLIGAVIVGIGMPSLSYEREAIAAYYDEKYEEGKQFAYVYPGMNRVLQAAGRVIRRESDKGVIVLIDDRFDDPIYKKIMPKLWGGLRFISTPKELRESLDKFWAEGGKTE